MSFGVHPERILHNAQCHAVLRSHLTCRSGHTRQQSETRPLGHFCFALRHRLSCLLAFRFPSCASLSCAFLDHGCRLILNHVQPMTVVVFSVVDHLARGNDFQEFVVSCLRVFLHSQHLNRPFKIDVLWPPLCTAARPSPKIRACRQGHEG